MPPGPAVLTDEPACRAVAADDAFAQVVVHGPAGADVVHAPLTLPACANRGRA